MGRIHLCFQMTFELESAHECGPAAIALSGLWICCRGIGNATNSKYQPGVSFLAVGSLEGRELNRIGLMGLISRFWNQELRDYLGAPGPKRVYSVLLTHRQSVYLCEVLA